MLDPNWEKRKHVDPNLEGENCGKNDEICQMFPMFDIPATVCGVEYMKYSTVQNVMRNMCAAYNTLLKMHSM